MKKWIILDANTYEIRAVLRDVETVLPIYESITALYGRCFILGV